MESYYCTICGRVHYSHKYVGEYNDKIECQIYNKHLQFKGTYNEISPDDPLIDDGDIEWDNSKPEETIVEESK